MIRPRRISRRSGALGDRLRLFVRSVANDDTVMAARVLRSSQPRWLFAPLAYTVGAFAMLLQGLRRLLANPRLVGVEVLPAIWLWLALYDLRLQILHGRSFHSAEEAAWIPVTLAVAALTAIALFLNVVFAFAVVSDGPPSLALGYRSALKHRLSITIVGLLVGVALALSVTLAAGLPHQLFSVSRGAAVALLSVVYLSLPSRLARSGAHVPRQDRLIASTLGALLSTVVTAPFYLLSRIGLLMLSSKFLVAPGYALLTVGVLLQAGGVGATRAIRMSGLLVGSGDDRTQATG